MLTTIPMLTRTYSLAIFCIIQKLEKKHIVTVWYISSIYIDTGCILSVVWMIEAVW